jgi:hypothetical protein
MELDLAEPPRIPCRASNANEGSLTEFEEEIGVMNRKTAGAEDDIQMVGMPPLPTRTRESYVNELKAQYKMLQELAMTETEVARIQTITPRVVKIIYKLLVDTDKCSSTSHMVRMIVEERSNALVALAIAHATKTNESPLEIIHHMVLTERRKHALYAVHLVQARMHFIESDTHSTTHAAGGAGAGAH